MDSLKFAMELISLGRQHHHHLSLHSNKVSGKLPQNLEVPFPHHFQCFFMFWTTIGHLASYAPWQVPEPQLTVTSDRLVIPVIPGPSGTRSLACPPKVLAYHQERFVSLPIFSLGQPRHQLVSSGQDGQPRSSDMCGQGGHIKVKTPLPIVCQYFQRSIQLQHPHLSSAPVRTSEYMEDAFLRARAVVVDLHPHPPKYFWFLLLCGDFPVGITGHFCLATIHRSVRRDSSQRAGCF